MANYPIDMRGYRIKILVLLCRRMSPLPSFSCETGAQGKSEEVGGKTRGEERVKKKRRGGKRRAEGREGQEKEEKGGIKEGTRRRGREGEKGKIKGSGEGERKGGDKRGGEKTKKSDNRETLVDSFMMLQITNWLLAS